MIDKVIFVSDSDLINLDMIISSYIHFLTNNIIVCTKYHCEYITFSLSISLLMDT